MPAAPRLKIVLRLVAACLVLASVAASAAHADEPSPGFWAQLAHDIFTFNSRGLMATLGRPEFTVLAFVAINLIVFVETGLLLGFFLPGDSLLVSAGLIAANPVCGWSLPLLILTLCASAILGDSLGYSIGWKTGPRIFSREKSLLFNRDHLLKAQEFYEKHGGKTILLARFMPILRTFAPVVAGVGRMEYRRFLFYNVFGGVGWVVSMVLVGYFLPSLLNPPLARVFGEGFQVQDHIEKIVVIVVLLSISPGLVLWAKSKLAKKPGYISMPSTPKVAARSIQSNNDIVRVTHRSSINAFGNALSFAIVECF